MSYIGTTEIGKMFLGSVEIDKAYLGTDLVFDSGGVTPGITPVFYTYLYFDGTAYVDTNYTLPSACSIGVRLGAETQKKAQRVFRASGGSGLVQMIYSSSTNSTNRAVAVYYDSTSLSASATLAFSTTTFNFFLTPKRYGWGTTKSTAFTKGSNHPTGGLQIGGWDSGNPFTGRMETFRVYGSDAQNATSAPTLAEFTPVATFRPCTYNGEAGFWYVEGSAFYGNSAGSGTLTASNS